MSPFASPTVAIPLFYASGFLAILLTVLTFSALFRIAFFPEKTLEFHLSQSFRHGIFVASAAAILAIFLQFRLLTAPIAAMTILIFVFLEMFFARRN